METQKPISQVARDLGVSHETLRNWVRKHKREHRNDEAPLDINERARLKELERINRQQAMEIEFLKKAASYFAKDHQ